MTDAVATVLQVAKIKPEFFEDDVASDDPLRARRYFSKGHQRRSQRTLSEIDRYGSASFGIKRMDNSEAVVEKGLPTRLSDVVVRTNAVIGDIWRLAVEKVKVKPPTN